jgi:hypothetical protein
VVEPGAADLAQDAEPDPGLDPDHRVSHHLRQPGGDVRLGLRSEHALHRDGHVAREDQGPPGRHGEGVTEFLDPLHLNHQLVAYLKVAVREPLPDQLGFAALGVLEPGTVAGRLDHLLDLNQRRLELRPAGVGAARVLGRRGAGGHQGYQVPPGPPQSSGGQFEHGITCCTDCTARQAVR